jgi:DNA-binding NarL/FixJ family response regulator
MNHLTARRLNVLVMHSDPLLSAGLVAALRQHPSFEMRVHGDENLSAAGRQIDVVIADYENAMRLAQLRHDPGPLADAGILALTANDREADIRRAIEAGVQGYLLAGVSLSELIQGVTIVGQGSRYLCLSVAQRMADSLTRTALTLRELEVLRLAASGHANKIIARQLEISVGTVKSHMSAIMTKLGASSRIQAANLAISRGLVEQRGLPQTTASAWRAPAAQPWPQYA